MSEKDPTVNPRYRGLRPNPDALGVTLLEDDEDTRTMRVRARADVIQWAAALTAAERGAILAGAYRASQQGAGRPAQPSQGKHTGQGVKRPSRATQGQAEAVTLGTVPDNLNELRPQHIPIIQALQSGGSLARDPGGAWRLRGGSVPGRTIKAATVELLTREGVLIVQN